MDEGTALKVGKVDVISRWRRRVSNCLVLLKLTTPFRQGWDNSGRNRSMSSVCRLRHRRLSMCLDDGVGSCEMYGVDISEIKETIIAELFVF